MYEREEVEIERESVESERGSGRAGDRDIVNVVYMWMSLVKRSDDTDACKESNKRMCARFTTQSRASVAEPLPRES